MTGKISWLPDTLKILLESRGAQCGGHCPWGFKDAWQSSRWQPEAAHPPAPHGHRAWFALQTEPDCISMWVHSREWTQSQNLEQLLEELSWCSHQDFLPCNPQISEGCWVSHLIIPNDLGSLNTEFPPNTARNPFSDEKSNSLLYVRWSLRSAFCCYKTQMSSAKVF